MAIVGLVFISLCHKSDIESYRIVSWNEKNIRYKIKLVMVYLPGEVRRLQIRHRPVSTNENTAHAPVKLIIMFSPET